MVRARVLVRLALAGFVGSLIFGSRTVHADSLSTIAVSTPAPAPPVCTTPAPAKDPTAWDKSILFGLNYTSGNTETTTLNLGGKIARDYEGDAWLFQGDYNYGNAAASPNDPREENKNNVRVLGNYKHIYSDTWYLGVGNSFYHDEIADLDYRFILSPSPGVFLVREDSTKLSLEAGPAYVWEKLGGVGNDFLAGRVADRLDFKLTDNSKLFQAVEFLVSTEDAEQYIINGEAGIDIALNESISLVLSIRDNYINKPAADRVQNDFINITAIKVSL